MILNLMTEKIASGQDALFVCACVGVCWKAVENKKLCVCVYLSLCVPTLPQRVVWYCSGSVRVKMVKLLQRQRAARLMGMNEISAACTMPQQTESRQHKRGESAPLIFSSDRIISVHLSLIELTLYSPIAHFVSAGFRGCRLKLSHIRTKKKKKTFKLLVCMCQGQYKNIQYMQYRQYL